jgi:DNA repair/transcription protein MET18/MMS19
LVNKLPLKATVSNLLNEFTLEEAIDIIFNSRVMKSCSEESETVLSGLGVRGVDASVIQIHSISGLAWVGKGLLMRGHEKLKDVIMVFLSFLTSKDNFGALRSNQDSSRDFKEYEVVPVMKSAAVAFHTLMSDSEDCLNKTFKATVRPLYKQRFFNTVIPLLLSSLQNSDAPMTRSVHYRAFAHVVSNTPLTAILSEAKNLIPVILDALPVLSEEIPDKDIVYSVLLVLSGILMDKKGKEVVIENVSRIIKCLVELVSYPHMMLIRETSIQCLIAMSELPHTAIYPMRKRVLSAISKALDDPKRVVRQESVRCQQAWSSMAS